MLNSLRIRDDVSFGLRPDDAYSITLNFPTNFVTPREIIRERVFSEVNAFNSQMPEIFRGLVQPTGTEKLLNGFKVRERKKIDPQEQYSKAVEAFEHNGFVMLVDDLQIDTLDEQIEIGPDMEITFLKLVPLVGG
jgi:hypothetical protein